MLLKIRNWLRNLARRLFKTAQPTLQSPAVAVPQNMHPTGLTSNVGGIEYPLYYLHGSRKLPHILSGHTFVPLSVFGKK
jgi:hypothetical protein